MLLKLFIASLVIATALSATDFQRSALKRMEEEVERSESDKRLFNTGIEEDEERLKRLEEEEQRIKQMEEEEERFLTKRDSKCGLTTPTEPVPSSHSACLGPSPSLIEELKPTDAEKKEIVDHHNKLRAGVSPPAANMFKLTWDDDLALTAQKWASHCESNHDTYEQRNIPGLYSVGQNMYSTTGGIYKWTKMIDGWYDEVNDFTYGVGSKNGKVVGHYTQVVAAKTTKVGCGSAKCKGGSTFKTYTYCNYALAGNKKFTDLNGKTTDEVKNPYRKGSKACEGCQSSCEDNLCVCKESEVSAGICYNGGELFADDCACDCSKTKYVGKHCEVCLDNPGGATSMRLTCAAAKAKGYCKYSNVAAECCSTCK